MVIIMKGASRERHRAARGERRRGPPRRRRLGAESFRMPRQAAVEEEEGTLAMVTDTIKSYYDGSINHGGRALWDIWSQSRAWPRV
ncbi:hypothetical protein CRUP_001145 [Coryphaenoides rupestris]|nr:hypothetical protein CRUP_001145 [Coryphaenoides rupestris]